MRNVVVLGFASLFTDISSEMVYPLLPLYLSAKLGAAPAVIGLIEGVAESMVSFLKIGSGYVSDRLRRRKWLTVLGYVFSLLGKVIIFLSTRWGHVFAGRVADRFGKGVRSAPRDALIADTTAVSKRGRAFGLHRMMDTAGAIIGILLAYYFLRRFDDFHKVFFYAVIPAAAGVMILFLVKEKKPSPEKKRPVLLPGFKQWRVLHPSLKVFLAITVVFTAGNSSNQFLLLRSRQAGFAVSDVLLLYLVYNLAYALFSYPAGRLSDIIGRKAMLGAGYFCYGVVYLGFAVVKNPQLLWLFFALYGCYMGLTDGVEKAFLTDLAGEDTRATILGLHGTLTGIGLLPASLLAGILWQAVSPSAPFYFGAVTALLSGLGIILFIPRRKNVLV